MNTERLLKLAEFLDTVDPLNFDIRLWSDQTDCGTVACAVGWACTIPEFQLDGLRIESGVPIYNSPSELPHYGFDAAGAFFVVPREEAHYLFSKRQYIKNNVVPKDVAVRIRSFVAEYGEKSIRE